MAAVCLALAAAMAGAETSGRLPAGVGADWALRGEGTVRWLGLRLYEAALWTRAGQAWHPARPFALEIRYARAVAGADLVAVSLDEMNRLGFGGADDARRWRPLLERAFPSVEAGDAIVGVAEPDGQVAFYHRGTLTAEVRDPAFARAFFAIWLDPRTREPALRARLLGVGDEG